MLLRRAPRPLSSLALLAAGFVAACAIAQKSSPTPAPGPAPSPAPTPATDPAHHSPSPTIRSASTDHPVKPWPARAAGPIAAYPFNAGRVFPTNPYGIRGGRRFERGWYTRWIDNEVARDYALGYRRVYVRGPFGKAPGDPPHQIDTAAVVADDPLWSWVLDDFRAAMLYAEQEMPDLRFLIHMGSSSPTMRAQPDDAAARAHFERSMAPLIAHDNIDICIDTSAGWQNDHPSWAWIEWLRSELEPRGRRVYVEALPLVNNPAVRAQTEYDALALYSYATFRVGRAPDHPKAVRLHDSEYETIIWLNTKAAYDKEGVFEEFVAACARHGWTPMIDRWRMDGFAAAELIHMLESARSAMQGETRHDQ